MISCCHSRHRVPNFFISPIGSIDLQPQKIVVDPTSAKCKLWCKTCKLWCKVHNDRNSISAVTVNDARYLRESYTLAAKQSSFCGFGPEHELGCHIQFVAPAVLCLQHDEHYLFSELKWSQHSKSLVSSYICLWRRQTWGCVSEYSTDGCWWSFPCPQSDQCSRRASLGRLGKSRGQLFFW
ncbi:Aspartate carbamoyltransferase [Trichinella spiralis]|uniref:Aspartate carbamoyltransferase n=1 Tax=Trichinella spiralis TaxID=6334 RepID=A0ABR3K2P3_TRISP